MKRVVDLNPNQMRFVHEYAIDRNATRAAIAAGYGKGNSEQASVTAARLLKKPHIKAEVDRLAKKHAARCETSSDWVRRRLKEEAEDYSKGASPAARVRAIELTAKLNGDFVEERKNARLPLEDFDTASLRELEKALADRVAADVVAQPGNSTAH